MAMRVKKEENKINKTKNCQHIHYGIYLFVILIVYRVCAVLCAIIFKL